MNKIKSFYLKWKDYVRIDVLMYFVMIFIIIGFIIIQSLLK